MVYCIYTAYFFLLSIVTGLIYRNCLFFFLLLFILPHETTIFNIVISPNDRFLGHYFFPLQLCHSEDLYTYLIVWPFWGGIYTSWSEHMYILTLLGIVRIFSKVVVQCFQTFAVRFLNGCQWYLVLICIS